MTGDRASGGPEDNPYASPREASQNPSDGAAQGTRESWNRRVPGGLLWLLLIIFGLLLLWLLMP